MSTCKFHMDYNQKVLYVRKFILERETEIHRERQRQREAYVSFKTERVLKHPSVFWATKSLLH